MQTAINVRGRLIDLQKPLVMGIINITPDSFYADSRTMTEASILARAHKIIDEGGSIIDIGACSTRPDSSTVSEDEEAHRLSMALPLVRKELPDAVISVDTYRPEVARRCVEEWGADIVNDVSGEVMSGIADLHVPYILMSQEPTLEKMMLRWAEQMRTLAEQGVADVILDPGFGFGKTLQQNYEILSEMERLAIFGQPILVGLSRKSMIYKLLDNTPADALNGTTVLNTIAIQKGAVILRVHDVRQAVQTIRLSEATKFPNNIDTIH